MKTKSSKIISEVQKVRFMIMDIIYHNQDRSVMIPSSNELAAHFGIARYTVRQALEKMTEQGYLYTKRGTGTFTIPQSISIETAGHSLIGIRIGTGDHFYYDATILNELGVVFQILSKRNCNVRLLTESADNADEYERLLENSYIDALISISADPEFTESAAAKMPVVSIGIEAKGANNILYGGKNVAGKLLEKHSGDGKLKILNLSTEKELKNLNQCLTDTPGIDYTHFIMTVGNEKDIDHAKDIILQNNPDIIMIRQSQLNKITEILNGLDIKSGSCKLLMVDASNPKPFDSGMRLNMNISEVLELATDEILKILNGGDNTKFQRFFEYSLMT